MTSLIELDGISHSYGGPTVLEHVHLTIDGFGTGLLPPSIAAMLETASSPVKPRGRNPMRCKRRRRGRPGHLGDRAQKDPLIPRLKSAPNLKRRIVLAQSGAGVVVE